MKYLFSLFILFFSLWGNLYANINDHNISYTLDEAINHIDSDTQLEHYKFSENFFQTTLEKGTDLVFFSKNEVADEDSSFSLKKQPANTTYFSNLSCGKQIEYLCNNVKIRSHYNNLFTHSAKIKLNILLGVFLI